MGVRSRCDMVKVTGTPRASFALVRIALARFALARFAGVDEIHRGEDAKAARLGHGCRAEIQGMRYADRSLRRDAENLKRSQCIVGDKAPNPCAAKAGKGNA